MNKEAWDVLNKIILKEPHELTETDRGFLKARRSYLTEDQCEKFRGILNEKEKEENSEELEDLREEAKKLGIKSVHLYKDAAKLKKKIEEVQK